jgi:arylsulfatase A
LTDFSDFFATAADLAGAKLPQGVKLDSHSFAPQIQGKKGAPREWVYVELNGQSYVRDAKFKLTAGGEMFDLSEAPFKEIPVVADSKNKDAAAARKALQSVLDDHKALPGHPVDKQKRQQNKAQQRKRAQRRQAAEKAA